MSRRALNRRVAKRAARVHRERIRGIVEPPTRQPPRRRRVWPVEQSEGPPLTPEAKEARLRLMWEAVLEVPVTMVKAEGEAIIADARELAAWRAAADRGLEVLHL